MNDIASKAFQPITGPTEGSILRQRAKFFDLWQAHWPDDSKLLAARDRFNRILLYYCQWPNAFFIPDDDIYILLDAGNFESLDLVEVIMTLEEMFEIRIDDEMAQNGPLIYREGSTYEQMLRWLIDIFEPDKDIAGVNHKWEPFSLPDDYFDNSTWQNLKRCLPFTWSDRSLHRYLRETQVARPLSWPKQWVEYDSSLIRLRDQISQILVDELEWFDDAFIPQDRLEAIFHSHGGLKLAAQVLGTINKKFGSDVEFTFITSRQYTYDDFLKTVACDSQKIFIPPQPPGEWK